jgi:hypothetical protein
LRLDPAEDNVEILNEATSFVYSRGLVALSLWGNNITGKGALMFARLLRKNDWLLGKGCHNFPFCWLHDDWYRETGLNLAENNINELNMAILVEELKNNAILQSILLRNNPGLEVSMATALCSSVMEKSKSVSKSLSEGFARLDVLEPRVSWLLKCWMTLQCEETRDLIQGRRLMMNLPDEAVRQSAPRKHLTKESPEDIYLKAYSIFNYISDFDLSKPNLPVHPSGNQEDDDPVLYDFSGNGSARLSFDGQTRSSALLGAAERYNTTSTLTNSNASNPMVGQEYDRHEFSSTVKRVQEPFHELLFRPSVGSPVPFKHGAEYDESVDASVDHRPRQRLTKARQQADELDRAIAVPSPPAQRRDSSNRRSGDIDGWEYWPDDKPAQREGRPPSRISMRPKSAPSVDYVRSPSHSDIPRFMRSKEDFAHRRSSSASRGEYDRKEAWGEIRKRSLSPPRRAWCPSSYVPQASDGTRKRTSDKEQKPPSSAMTRYASPAMISHRRSSGSSARSRIRANHNNTPSNSKPRKSTTAKYDEITNSVLAATRHLEQVSRRLCDVAESLSESAMMNVSNIQSQNVSNMHDVTPTRYGKNPLRDKSNVVNNQQADADIPSFSNQIFTDQEMENERLEEVVRRRMKARLREYLSKELQSEWND